MPGIFISYRRSDNPDATGRIYDHLVAEFGRAKVFKDIDSIPLGRDFRSHLNEVIGQCAVVLAIVGPRWVDARNEGGQRRLDDADDFVRIELEAAMARDVPVVPVLVGHALMPGTAQLPASLAPLAYRQSIEVRPDPDFHHDATRLVTALRVMIDPSAAVQEESTLPPPAPADTMRTGQRTRAWQILALAAIAGLSAALMPALQHLRETPPPETRVDIVAPGRADFGGFALSPDGRQIVYVSSSGGPTRLWLRSLTSTTAQPLAGTENAQLPFWSPDGHSIGFFDGKALKRVDLGGGAARILAPTPSFRGASWGANGAILFAPTLYSGLMRISASGGTAEPVTKLGPKQTSHRLPWFLPDGNRFLFLVQGSLEVAGIYLGALDGREPFRLTAADQSGVYLPSGWLLWNLEGSLVARRLDLDKPALTGELVTLTPSMQVLFGGSGWSAVSAAFTGQIVYRTLARGELAVYDRSGIKRGSFGSAEDGIFAAPKVSPDGRRVVVQKSGDIWLLDGVRATRFTFDAALTNGRGLWSPDGNWIAWDDTAGFNRKLASGAGATEQLVASNQSGRTLGSWSPDGRYLLYYATDAVTLGDLWLLPVSGKSTPSVLLKTRFDERGGVFSPDGRWMAYFSDESGRYEVYVQAFAPPGSTTSNAGARKWQVSTAGGSYPVWRRDGRELFYLSPTGVMTAVPIAVNGDTPESGLPVELFSTRTIDGASATSRARQYDVTPDGRFLINTDIADDAAPLTLILNWNPEAQERK